MKIWQEPNMEGFVYVISNNAMPGLVKVGFTTTKPEERAASLGGTHSPHPFIVEYWVAAVNPRAVEKRAHITLQKHREKKEWFRCSIKMATEAVRRAADTIHGEEFSRAETEERLARERAAAKLRMQTEKAAAERAAAERERKEKLRADVEKRYRPELERLGSAPGTGTFVIWAGIAAAVLIGVLSSKPSAAGCLVGGAIAGVFVGTVLKESADGRKKKSAAYLATQARYEAELKAIDTGTAAEAVQHEAPGNGAKVNVTCPGCEKLMRLPVLKKVDATCLQSRVPGINRHIGFHLRPGFERK
jgi:T5orf172 domain